MRGLIDNIFGIIRKSFQISLVVRFRLSGWPGKDDHCSSRELTALLIVIKPAVFLQDKYPGYFRKLNGYLLQKMPATQITAFQNKLLY